MTCLSKSQKFNLRNSSVSKTASNIKWATCDGKASNYYDIVGIEIVGDIAFGKSIKLTGKSNVKKEFTIYGSHLTISISGFTIFSGILRPDQPVSFTVGSSDYTTSKTVPFTPIAGNYKVIAEPLDKNDTAFECYTITTTIA